jgi:hypothetical protein
MICPRLSGRPNRLRAGKIRRSASLRVRGALPLLSLQVITVNRHPAAPCPRLAPRPRRRAARRKTGALPRRTRRTRRARRVRGAVPTLSARPLCAQARHHARRGQRHDPGALSGPDSASRAARRDHHSEPRGQPKLTVCTSGKGHGNIAPARRQQSRALTAGKVFTGSGRMSILPGQEALRRLSAWPHRGPASRPHRWRSPVRMGVRDLTPRPLRYFAAVPGP